MTELHERELHDLLERVSAIEGQVDVDEHWVAGRRRRTRRGAAVALAAGVAAVTAVGALAQTGVLGGSGATPTGPAAVPDDLETFVLSVPGATGGPQASDLRVATAQDLSGTSWTLQEGLWQDAASASDLTGTTAPTVVTFGDVTLGGGWGLTIGGCGSAAMPGPTLDDRGRFAGTLPATDDVGCPEDVQAAEDFWAEALAGGGQLTLAGDGGWLLLSVAAPAPPGPTATDDAAPTATGTQDGTSDGGTAAPLPSSTVPRPTTPSTPTTSAPARPAPTSGPAPPGDTGPVAPRPTSTPFPTRTGTSPTGAPAPTGTPTAGPAPGTPAPTSAPATAGPTTSTPTTAIPGQPFLAPTQVSTDEPWPGAGGDLFAPTVRAGTHDGFDRVVVDLSGVGDPGWRAAWTEDARLDGSGAPAGVAGDSVLEVRLTGMGYPEPGSDLYAGGTFGLDTHTLGRVVEVQRTTPFEGMLQVFVGVSGDPLPYRVFLLEEPLRLVVDVRTAP